MTEKKYLWIMVGSAIVLWVAGLFGIWDAMTENIPGHFIQYQVLCSLIGTSIIAVLIHQALMSKNVLNRFRTVLFCIGSLMNFLPLLLNSKFSETRHVIFNGHFYPGPAGIVLCFPLLAHFTYKIERPEARISTFIFPVSFFLLFNLVLSNLSDYQHAFLLDILIFILILTSRMTLKIKTFVSALYLSPFMLLIAKIMTTRYLAVRFYNAFHYKLDPVDSGYSMVKAQEFISSGGLFGIGFKNTVTSEVDPLTSISQCFILQYTGKEAGMAGLIMVAGICAVFLFSGFRLIQKIDTREQYIAAKCMFLWLFIPMFFGLIKILNISSGFPPYSIPFMSFSNGYNVSCYLALGGLLHYVIANSRNVSDSFKTLSEESESSQPLPK